MTKRILGSLLIANILWTCLSAPMNTRGAETVATPSAIAEVLGSAADWKITPAQPELGSGPGTTLTGTVAQTLSLESNAKQTARVEPKGG